MATAVETEHGRHVIARVEAERAGRMVQLTAVLGAALCIALAAALQTPINNQRRELQLVAHSDLYKELPPVYALVGAAGGPVRALTSIYLWHRAEHLKQEGKYFQSQNLAKWICTLQPRFPTVWVNRAWDLSYNISVGTQTRRERWQWVYNGIRLLRDEGIPNNDRFAGLYHYLSWIWFHKVGDRLDDFHNFYKRQWAGTMEILLGAPPTGVPDAEVIDWFRPVAEAPAAFDELIAARPGVEALAADLRQLGIDVRAQTRTSRVHHPLEETFFREYAAWARAEDLRVLRAGPRRDASENAPLFAFFDAAPKEDFNALLAWLRAKVLREQYKMDPRYMLELSSRLNIREPIPIDWRTPYSQGLYWAMLGVDKGKELKTVKEFDLMNTDRILAFALARLRESGRYIFRLNLEDPMDSYLAMAPDFRYLEALHNTYLKIGEFHKEEGEELDGARTSELLRSGHINFLRDAVVELWLAGRATEARKWFDYLVETYRDQFTGQVQQDYREGMDAFVWNEVKDRIDTYNGVMTTIHAMLASAYGSLAAGWQDEYAIKIAHAARFYQRYQDDKVEDPQGRRTLPPFAQIRAAALANFLLSDSVPVIYRVWAWQREQDEVKRQIYDDLLPTFEELARREDFDPRNAFSEPPGLAQWRRENPAPLNPEDVVQQQKQREKQQEN